MAMSYTEADLLNPQWNIKFRLLWEQIEKKEDKTPAEEEFCKRMFIFGDCAYDAQYDLWSNDEDYDDD